VTYSSRDGEGRHAAMAREAVAARLAKVKQFDFAGPYDPAKRYAARLYLVPSDTLVGREAAAKLGVRTENDVFGGVVPTAFAATKTITHPLVHPKAYAPTGWSHDFAEHVSEAVLHGYTACSSEDAHRAVPLSTEAQLAISRALVYDSAADACFAGFFSSRRNYDVVEGTDARGRRRAGVLEQSWRVGGASAAEVEALLAFRDDPAITVLRAATVETYGASPALPEGAIVV